MDMVAAILRTKVNPASVQRLVHQQIRDSSNGLAVLYDPSNPMALAMEAISTVSAGVMQSVGIETKRLYKSAVNNMADLYRHMADEDYIGRFSTCSRAPFILLIGMDMVLSKAVPIPGSSGRSKLTIPRHTCITVADTPFTLEYPIDIIVLPHGAITIVFDDTELSPIDELVTNRVNWQIVNIEGVKTIAITLPAPQVKITPSYIHLNSINGYQKVFGYTDAFYFCRAYIQNTGDGVWTEIGTTHTDMVYDPTRPTVCLRVLDAGLSVSIPQIYFTNGLIKNELRIDIYTTKGPINLNLKSYDPDAFKVTFLDVDNVSTSPYTAPLLTMQKFQAMSFATVQGGAWGKSYSQLRDTVVGRDKIDDHTITELNLPTRGKQGPYDIVLMNDNVTDRHFVATRSLPAPVNKDTVTGMDLTMQLFQCRLSDLIGYDTIKLLDSRVILKPGTLFQDINGVLSLVPSSQIENLKNPAIYNPDALVNYVNGVAYRHLPFQYVIDVSNNISTCRAYLMNQPKITARNFVQENVTAGISMGSTVMDIVVSADGSGYTFALQLDATGFPADIPAANLGVQLSYLVKGTKSRIYYDGVLRDPIDSDTGRPVGDQWVYLFSIQTDFDVDRDGLMTTQGITSILELTAAFDLFYYTKNYAAMGYQTSSMDDFLNPLEIDGYDPTAVYLAVAQDAVTLQLGQALDSLWTRIRTIQDSVNYRTYPATVYATYPADVEKTNSAGQVEYVFNTTLGRLTTTIIHHAGDPVLDEDDQPLIAHHAGEYVLDAQQNKIPIGGTLAPIVEFDLFLMDGSYLFADDEDTVTYMRDSVASVTDWITNDIKPMAKLLFARSKLSFFPKKNLGMVRITSGDGQTSVIRAEQSLTVTYTISKTNYKNVALKASIEARTAGVIDLIFQQPTISVDDCATALRKEFVESVMSVRVDGLFGGILDAVTVQDNSVRPTVAKVLKLTKNQTIMVANDVNVQWITLGD